MAQVISTSRHGMVQPQLGGVRFFSSPHGRISEEISDEQAEQFLATPDHFKRHMGEPYEPPAAGKKPTAAAPKAAAPAGKPPAVEASQSPTF